MSAEEIQDRIKRLPLRRLAYIGGTLAVIILGIITIQMIRGARGFSHTIEVVDLLDVYCTENVTWPENWDDLGCGDLSGYVTIDFSISNDAIVKEPEILTKAVQPLFGSIDDMPDQEELLTEIGLKLQYKLKLKVIQDRLKKEARDVSKTEALEIGKLYCDYQLWGWISPTATRSGDIWTVTNTDQEGAAEIVIDAKTGNVR